MSFYDRLERHENVLSAVELSVAEQPDVELYRTGVEHTFPDLHHDLIEAGFSDPTSEFIRYQPDGILVDYTEKSITHFDVKVGENIEKDAYLTYQKLSRIGLSVLIILHYDGQRYRISFQDLVLEDGETTVSEYPNPYPVDSDGWITPRESSSSHYERMKQSVSMSGTPYKRILVSESVSSHEQSSVDQWVP